MAASEDSVPRWKENPKGWLQRWLPVTRNEIRLAFRSRIFLVALGVALILFAVRFVAVWSGGSPSENPAGSGGEGAVALENIFYLKFLLHSQLVSVVLMCLVVGCGLIARDLRDRTLNVYTSRSITMRDYLTGKFAAMVFFALCMTLLPVLLVFASDWILSAESLRDRAWLLAGVTAISLIITVTASVIVLAISSLCNSVANAVILWLGFHLALFLLSKILWVIFNLHSLTGANIYVSVRYLSQKILDIDRDFPLPWIVPVLYLAMLIVIAGRILIVRMRREWERLGA